MSNNLILSLRLLPEPIAVCKLPADAPVPDWAAHTVGAIVSITRTADELSLVVPERLVPPSSQTLQVESGWRAFMVAGPLAFGLVGILAGLTAPLARSGVPVFALSTFDTDYLLVKAVDLQIAVRALEAAGYSMSAAP